MAGGRRTTVSAQRKGTGLLIGRYEMLEEQTPFYYDYADGWKQLYMGGNDYYAADADAQLYGGQSFSGEFGYKADSVFYASYHGRGKAVAAKLGAGFLFVTLVYFITVTLYSAVVLGIFGIDGAELVIQTNRGVGRAFIC